MSNQELIKELNKKHMKSSITTIKPGFTVRVVYKFKELVQEGKKEVLKERTQSFEGLVVKVKGKDGDVNSTITVRKISDGIGVERIFPIHSQNIVSIENIKVAKVRRAKLYYMRERFGKAARLKEVRLTQAQKDAMMRNFDLGEKTKKVVKGKNADQIQEVNTTSGEVQETNSDNS